MDAEKSALVAAGSDIPGLPWLVGKGRWRLDELTEQIASDGPPEVWQAARRLLTQGMRPAGVLEQLLLAGLAEDPADPDADLKALDLLPGPDPARIEPAVHEAVRAQQPVPLDDVAGPVAAQLGMPADSPLLAAALDAVIDHCLDESAEMAMLAPDVLVHPWSLTEGAVLTHRLSESERADGILRLDPDLAGFAHHDPNPSGDEDGLVRAMDAPAWVGMPEWLHEFGVGTLLAVRVTVDGPVQLEALEAEPSIPEGLVDRLRAVYDAEVAEPWMPVSAADIVFGLLAADRETFAKPVPPLAELAEAAGLQRRGMDFAHEESVWRAEAALHRRRRVTDRLGWGSASVAAARVLEMFDGELDARDARAALSELSDPDVLEVVAEELFDFDGDPDVLDRVGVLSEQLFAVAGKPAEQAVARWLAAVAAEHRCDPGEAESHLRAAVRVDPSLEPAVDRLAWYESDRGNAADALALWRRIGANESNSEDARTIGPFAAGPERKLGRNERCWCGSGRKFKVCHLGVPALPPLPERVGWLCRKATAYLTRRIGGVHPVVIEHAVARAVDPGDADSVMQVFEDPLTLDVVLTESGWFERFLAERAPLLPDDEAMLARAWTLVQRTVYEVLDLRRDAGLTLRDLRTGDHIEVRERAFPQQAVVGGMVCGRAVSDGESHQFIGGLFSVAAGTEKDLLDLLDTGDGLALLEHVASLHRPPRLVSMDGEPLLDCRAVVRTPDTEQARHVLDEAYQPGADGWTWAHQLDDDQERVLATITLHGEGITVRTFAESRLDEVLDGLRAEIPGATVVTDERDAFDPSQPHDAAEPVVPLDPEVIAQLQDRQERRWCDEAIPALDGYTPRAAAADPTRRDELIRLIDSFPEIDESQGVFGLRSPRLRELLGLTEQSPNDRRGASAAEAP